MLALWVRIHRQRAPGAMLDRDLNAAREFCGC
jgi:hypothetical protein